MPEPSLLILDNHRDPQDRGAPLLRSLLSHFPRVQWTLRRGPERDLPSLDSFSNWNAVIVSGSSTSAVSEERWVEELVAWIQHWISSQKPLLGICFGHQLLVRSILGKEHIRTMPQPSQKEWINVQAQNQSALCLPEKIKVYSNHREEVFDLPPSFEVLASSPSCAVEAFQVLHSPLYGVQFHPEKAPEAWTLTFLQNFFSLCQESRTPS